jgi:hypothetical protein
MTDIKNHPRRRFLKLGGSTFALGIIATILPRYSRADGVAHLSESDATTAALGYKDDAAKVDAAKYPTYRGGLLCSNCKFFTRVDPTSCAGCQLFPGKAVAAKGWCSGYNAKA